MARGEVEQPPRDAYEDATALASTIRNLLSDEKILNDIVKSLPDNKKPPYWQFLDKKTGMSAVVMAQLLKAAGGDTAAAGFLAKYGWGDKLQVDVSSFYSDRKFEIEIVEPNKLDVFDIEEIEEAQQKELNDGQNEGY